MIPFLLLAALSFSSPQDPPLPPAPPPKQEEVKMVWFDRGLNAAIALANAEQKVVMIYFTSELSEDAQKMRRESFTSEQVAIATKDFVCVTINYDKQRDTADRYRVKETPVVVWLNPDGSARERVNGYEAPAVFLANIYRVKSDLNTINHSRRKIAANGNDLEARFDVYTRLKELGDLKGAEDQKAAIQKLDPEGKSRGAHHFRYEDITTAIEQYWAKNAMLDMEKVGQLQAFVEVETDPELLWDGWMRLANTHEYLGAESAKQGKLEEAAQHRVTRRQFLAFAWRSIPPDVETLHFRGYAAAAELWDQRDELSAEDKEFLVRIGERIARTFDLDGLAHDYYARALFLSGKRDEALVQVRRAMELDPANSTFKERLKEFGGS